MLCAKFRAKYTDIPHTKKIYKLAKGANRNKISNFNLLNLLIDIFPPKKEISILEGRYLAINDVLNKSSNCSVLELASGLSPRMLEFHDKINYIESDLNEMVSIKKYITNDIYKNFNKKNILKLNPLNLEELLSFGKYFDKNREINIINEGFMMYLSNQEQTKLRDNIASFLSTYSKSGSWITTDFSSREFKKEKTLVNLFMNKIENRTNRKFNRFFDDKSVHDFLRKGGLNAELIDNKNVIDNLSCLKKMNLKKDDAKKVLNLYKVWKIKLIQ